jgi:hypothetical protein
VGQSEARMGPGRARGVREAAFSTIRGGPLHVLPAVTAVLVAASAMTVLILTVAPAPGDQPALNEVVRGAAAALCALIGFGYLAYRWRFPDAADRWAPRESDSGVVTALLSAAVVSLLLLVPVYLLAARTHGSPEHWIGFGFFDKRWVPITFLVGTLGVMIVITVVSQVVRAASAGAETWHGWAGALFGSATAPVTGVVSTPFSWIRRLALVGTGLAFTAYFFGPPWHVALSPINVHETPMMSGVQAIAHGAVPYIGSAAVQYGPGSELIHYLYLDRFGFDVVHFRQSTVLLYCLAATIFFVVLFLRLPTRLALVTSLVSVLLFPALQMISFQANGSIDGAVDRLPLSEGGFWGWPNAMRYIGVFAVALVFPAVAAARGRRALLSGVGLGLLFGFTCYVSQENLVGGITVIAALALLLAVSQTIPARMVLRAVVRVAIGFVAIAAVVFAYYAANGELGRFLELYYLIPPAVAAGYSDTVFYGGFSGQWGHLYYLIPFFLGALCVLSMFELRPLRIARGWSAERVLLVSALTAAAVIQTGSMLRADSAHLVNTLLALPVALVLAVAYLPGLLGIATRRARLTTAVALAAVPLALLPLAQFENVFNRLTWPLERVSYRDESIAWQRADPRSVAASRLGPVLRRNGQWCCSYFRFRYPVSMREFAGILNRVHGAVGNRRVYVPNFIEPLMPGAAYFLADLRPADVYFDQQTMAMNERLLGEFLDYFREHLSGVESIVAVYPDLPEVRMFKAAYPNYRQREIPYSWGTITVLTR